MSNFKPEPDKIAVSVGDTIPLNEAVLCVNCLMISRAKNGHCPVCAAPAGLLNLANALERGAPRAYEIQGYMFVLPPPFLEAKRGH